MQISHKRILTVAVTIMIAVLAAQPLIAGQSLFASTLKPVHGPSASTGVLTINASGQATVIGNAAGNASLSATLLLNGTVSTNNGGQLKIGGITGTMSIGTQSYAIVSGQGTENGKGMVEINAQTSNGQELTLHGAIQGNSAMFTAPESKLASQYFLSLQGPVTIGH